MKRTSTILLALGMYAVPAIAFAQTLGSILADIRGLLDTLVPILIVLALVYFIWGVIKYITSTGDEEGQSQARNIMIWGIIALFVIVSVWGLVAVLQSTFGVGTGSFITPPTS